MIKRLIHYLTVFILYLITLYKRFLSPFLPYACRYTPTCSEYMFQAIKTHGLIKGIYLGVCRILRCHPWGKSGFDPVPTRKNKYTNNKDTD